MHSIIRIIRAQYDCYGFSRIVPKRTSFDKHLINHFTFLFSAMSERLLNEVLFLKIIKIDDKFVTLGSQCELLPKYAVIFVTLNTFFKQCSTC